MLEVPSMQQMFREGKSFSTIFGLITRCLFGVFIYLFRALAKGFDSLGNVSPSL